MDTVEFLKLFGNPIVCVSSDIVRNSRMKVVEIDDALRKNRESGNDVYFYVSSGGTKQEQISHLKSLFIDLDAGRDKDTKKYLPLKEVKKFKTKVLRFLDSCLLEPTVIVETRNGFHVYWVLSKPPTYITKF